MKFHLSYIISFVLIHFCLFSQAQVSSYDVDSILVANDQVDSTVEETTSHSLLSEMAVNIDYGKLFDVLLEDETKWEAGFSIVLREKIQLIAEYGITDLRPKNVYKNAGYEVTGNYLRFGASYFLRPTPKNSASIGLRYGLVSDFEHRGNYRQNIPTDDSGEPITNLQPTLSTEFRHGAMSASWVEVVLQTETRFWKFAYFGLQFRLRRKNSINNAPDQGELQPKVIPGYGSAEHSTTPAVNAYIKLKLL